MDRVQILATVFDAACFLLAHLDLYDGRKIDLDELRKSLRVIIQDSATARVLEVEKQLGFNVDKK